MDPNQNPTPNEALKVFELVATLNQFVSRMFFKLFKHYSDPNTFRWNDPKWPLRSIDLNIERCIEERDYVSAANYCLFAQAKIDAEPDLANPIDPAQEQADRLKASLEKTTTK